MLKKVKTAIVGCGMISDIYLKNLCNMFSIIELAGCSSRSMEKAEQKAAHYAVTKELLESGKHVYTEKVLALELDQAEDLIQTAKRNQLYLEAAPDTFFGKCRTDSNPSNYGFSDKSRGVGAADLAWAIRQGREPRASKEMAYHSLEVLHGIADSSKSGKAYEMKSDFIQPGPLPQGYQKQTHFGHFEADEEAALAYFR